MIGPVSGASSSDVPIVAFTETKNGPFEQGSLAAGLDQPEVSVRKRRNHSLFLLSVLSVLTSLYLAIQILGPYFVEDDGSLTRSQKNDVLRFLDGKQVVLHLPVEGGSETLKYVVLKRQSFMNVAIHEKEVDLPENLTSLIATLTLNTSQGSYDLELSILCLKEIYKLRFDLAGFQMEPLQVLKAAKR